MADALPEIERALDEVTKARQSVARGRSKQVHSVDEIDRLKSVSFAWFQTHRPCIAVHPSCPDVTAVDAAYRSVMEATGKHAARTTYLDGLADAKQALLALRNAVAATPSNWTPPGAAAAASLLIDPSPNFAPLAADPKMQSILNRRWAEVQQCIGCKAPLAATVMMGGLLESLLLARINSSPNKSAVFTAKSAPRDKMGKALPLAEWNLAKMVEVAHELVWISKSAKDVGNVLRDFRNYIHPHKEYSENLAISEHDVGMFWQVTKLISHQVLASSGKSP